MYRTTRLAALAALPLTALSLCASAQPPNSGAAPGTRPDFFAHMLEQMDTNGDGRISLDEYVAAQSFGLALMRLSPGTLFTEAVLGLLNPETRTLGPIIQSQMYGAIMGAPLPFGQSLLLIWPQITGLIAGMIVIFAAAYIIFQREEVRA